MLKLVYHNAVFGPIHLEYDRPVIRVGRSEDNDLVLRHPFVAPYHCVLMFRGEKVVWLPADADTASEAELQSLTGPEFGLGDQISIGELIFSLAHSAKTVAIPETGGPVAPLELSDAAAVGAGEGSLEDRYFCKHCQMSFPKAEVKRVGLVGRSKRCLCPKCSQVLNVEPDSASPERQRKGWGFRR